MTEDNKVKAKGEQWVSRVMPTGELMQSRKKARPSRKEYNEQFFVELRHMRAILERTAKQLDDLEARRRKGKGERWQPQWQVIADDGFGKERFVSAYRDKEIAALLIAECISKRRSSPDWMANPMTKYTIRLAWVPRDDSIKGLPTQDELVTLIESVKNG